MGSLATFGFWQWSRYGDSTLRSALSAIAFVAAFVTLLAISLTVFRISRRPGGLNDLYNPQHTYAQRWGVIYDTFRQTSIGYMIPFVFVTLLRGIIIGFGGGSGLAQIVALNALELVAFLGQSISSIDPPVRI